MRNNQDWHWQWEWMAWFTFTVGIFVFWNHFTIVHFLVLSRFNEKRVEVEEEEDTKY